MAKDPIAPLVKKSERVLSEGRVVLAQLEGKLRQSNIDPQQSANYTWLSNAVWTMNGVIEADKMNAIPSKKPDPSMDRAMAYNSALADLEAAIASAQGEIRTL